jgi:hypothetical protein
MDGLAKIYFNVLLSIIVDSRAHNPLSRYVFGGLTENPFCFFPIILFAIFIFLGTKASIMSDV